MIIGLIVVIAVGYNVDLKYKWLLQINKVNDKKKSCLSSSQYSWKSVKKM